MLVEKCQRPNWTKEFQRPEDTHRQNEAKVANKAPGLTA